jgi:hypothetical protein
MLSKLTDGSTTTYVLVEERANPEADLRTGKMENNTNCAWLVVRQ